MPSSASRANDAARSRLIVRASAGAGRPGLVCAGAASPARAVRATVPAIVAPRVGLMGLVSSRGRPLLVRNPIPAILRPGPVLFFSSESGEAALYRAFRRIVRAKGLEDFTPLPITISLRAPRLDTR